MRGKWTVLSSGKRIEGDRPNGDAVKGCHWMSQLLSYPADLSISPFLENHLKFRGG